MRLSVIPLAALFLVILSSVPAIASKRVALVIGNSDYTYAGTLKNPANDAEDMNAALKQLGFEVIYDIDLEKPQLEAKLHEFARALSGADVGLFFYAGHGLQVDGRNYIMPTDAELTDGEHMLPYELVELSKIQKTMEAATKTNIILLDACRNNPLARNLKKALGTRAGAVSNGLAKVEAGRGTLISYATHPGAVAADGKGRNSPYTAALKTHILTPGEDLNSILINVRRDVVAATDGAQVPWDQHALLEEIYLGGKIEVPAGGGGDAGYHARLKKQIETSTSVAELDTLKRLEPAFGPMIEARKKQLALLQEREEKRKKAEVSGNDEEALKRDPALSVKPGSGESYRDCDTCPEMVVVPAGSFMMGSPKSEEGGNENEGPQRKVTFSKPFAVGKFEVTWDEWDVCVADGGCDSGPVEKAGGDNGWGKGIRPVIKVDWNDATAYAAWLSKKTGKAYRLLSEAEWEHAARAGTTTAYFWGDKFDSSRANNGSKTVEVGRFTANAWDLHDMHGNVWEWTEDCWNGSYTGAPTDGSAWKSGECSRRVVRGGSWGDYPQGLRSANRVGYSTEFRFISFGFRLGRTLTP